MQTIKQFPEERRLEIIFDRFEDHDNKRFIKDVQQAALNVSGGGQFDMICDFSRSMVMPQDIARESKNLALWLVENGLRKSANILQSATQRMQISRVTEHDEKFAYFTSREEAAAWLAEGYV